MLSGRHVAFILDVQGGIAGHQGGKVAGGILALSVEALLAGVGGGEGLGDLPTPWRLFVPLVSGSRDV